MENEQNLIETDLIIDNNINLHLKETAVWGKFLGIMGFIYGGLLILMAVFAASIITKFSGQYAQAGGQAAAVGTIAVFYLALAGVVFFMSLHLYRFAVNMQMAIQGNDQDILTKSFSHLKIYFRFTGIVTVIALILSILGVVGLLLVTAFSRG